MRFLRKLTKSPKGLGGALICLTVTLSAVFAPLIAPHPPNEQNRSVRLSPPVGMEDSLPGYVLGTDGLGRDLLSRIVYGARISLLVALSAAGLSLVSGLVLGLISGYMGGTADLIIGRLVEMQLAFPFLLLAITFLAIAKPSVQIVVLVLALSSWPTSCRVVRARVLGVLKRDYVIAAKAIGASDLKIMARHLIPNVISILFVIGVTQIAQFVIAEATLSFLGLGVPPTIPTWGGIINEGRNYIWMEWWLTAFPGLAIVVTVVGFGLFGDWSRDYLDPTLRS